MFGDAIVQNVENGKIESFIDCYSQKWRNSISKILYDYATKKWFGNHIGHETTLCRCEKCGLFYKPSLGHKCKKEGEQDE